MSALIVTCAASAFCGQDAGNIAGFVPRRDDGREVKWDMKIEDSGMPEESYWSSLFDIERIVGWLGIPERAKVVEMGSGYGTFTVPVAALSQENSVLAFDIDPAMVDIVRRKLAKSGLSNAACIVRDLLAEGTGLESASVDVVLLFNIFHSDEKRALLQESSRILKPGGAAAIIHWRKDISTPRGPAIELRPDLGQITSTVEGLSLDICGDGDLLEPYHWGIRLVKRD